MEVYVVGLLEERRDYLCLIMEGKSRHQDREAVGYTVSTVREQRETLLGCSSLFFRSVQIPQMCTFLQNGGGGGMRSSHLNLIQQSHTQLSQRFVSMVILNPIKLRIKLTFAEVKKRSEDSIANQAPRTTSDGSEA